MTPEAAPLPDSILEYVRCPLPLVTWRDPNLGWPIAAPLDRCAELLGVDVAIVCELAANLEAYIRADGTKVWSLMQFERLLRPELYGRRQGGYVDRRQIPAADA
jgi:hypothetical protein